MNKRNVLLSLLNGKREPLEQLKAAELINSIPTVIISMPDGTFDIGNSQAFRSRFVTEEELNRVLENIGKGKTFFVLPNNGRSIER